MSYLAPQSDIQHILTHIIDMNGMIDQGLFGDVDVDLINAILEEAGKFAAEELAPLNHKGDQAGCTLKDGTVTTPPGWQPLYQKWQEAGWPALSANEDFGGQALPHIIAQCVGEFWNSANMAFGLCPLLTQGAVDAIAAHASPDLKKKFLPKMVSGAWTGTMNLTEPQAGSDLAAIRTKATPMADGTYLIKGTKIFITYGDHELTENIIHLVLARLPDAPAGTKGISLFIVPKFLVEEDGTIGARNDLSCTGLEKKLGIHGSPTCVMSYGNEEGAIGYLVGEENRGLFAMFTMMNLARLSVGTQGVAIMERASQQALSYAHERLQGAAIGSAKGAMDPILKHPDIRRELSLMQATIMACRAICLMTAKYIDIAERSTDQSTKQQAHQMAALFTPIAKAYSTDSGLEVTSAALQVHGGMGYIEETGAAQFARDARILPIYEGTNGIQAIDLMLRKLPSENGAPVQTLLLELAAINKELEATQAFAEKMSGAFTASLKDVEETLHFLSNQRKGASANAPTPALYAASPTLKLFGLTLGAGLLIKGAISAIKANAPDSTRQAALAALFVSHKLPQTTALKTEIKNTYANAASLTDDILK